MKTSTRLFVYFLDVLMGLAVAAASERIMWGVAAYLAGWLLMELVAAICDAIRGK